MGLRTKLFLQQLAVIAQIAGCVAAVVLVLFVLMWMLG